MGEFDWALVRKSVRRSRLSGYGNSRNMQIVGREGLACHKVSLIAFLSRR